MFRPRSDLPLAAPGPRPDPAPWEGRGQLRALAFATLWTTGPSPVGDAVFRLAALRRDPEGSGWTAFERWADPREAEEHGGRSALSSRIVQEFGVDGSDLEGAPPTSRSVGELVEFLRGRTVVVLDRESFAAWIRTLTGEVELGFRTIDVASLAGLFLPGRLASEGEELPGLLLGEQRPRGPGAIGPEELRTALAVLVGRVLGGDPTGLAVLAHGHHVLWEALRARSPDAAAELAFLLRLLEHPSAWRGERDELFPEHASLDDGRLSDALRAFATLEDALGKARPRWTRSREDLARVEVMPIVADEATALSDSDRRLVDEIFQERLARVLGPDATYRAGQHEVAARIAAGFGERELLLLHAPTGTGKTLAYLVPTCLWALRTGVRVGISTYTRALQEQAMDRDVPLVRTLLRAAGIQAELRVSVLKGRQNYLCWRGLLQELPPPDAPAEPTLAWLLLALFGLADREGDLDRFAARCPLGTLAATVWSAALGRILRRVRAATGCCSVDADRRSCGAEAARRRAERSHVVITNHAFTLSRREFFRHLVFDECEHLHDVAHDAFSHVLHVRHLEDELKRLGEALAPVVRRGVAGSEAVVSATDALSARRQARSAVRALTGELGRFEVWREGRRSERRHEDGHSLFREYVLTPEAADLHAAHVQLWNALAEASRSLALLAELLDHAGDLGVRGLRRTLELRRTALEELFAGLKAWLPRGEGGGVAFTHDTFHDVEPDPAGGYLLLARVLLPHEFLGRRYYPDLKGAVFLSATTWLRGGFEASATYLGLTRAAQPEEEEEREPSRVSTLRAPEAFDYGRVLVGVPRDAPSIRDQKEAFLTYTARFVCYLAERSRGRLLVLFTNAEDLLHVGRAVEGFLGERRIPLWYQGMEGSSKEELGELFRTHVDSVLLGLDTFWFGTDFPGHTLEYLVLVRLPYGVPDRYHHAQCAALGTDEQRRQIYMPRALAKFRQGFGRLMRREKDKGCVFVLDRRILDPRHRTFLRELPVHSPFEDEGEESTAALVVGNTDRCLDAALGHMGMKADIRRRGLERPFAGWQPDAEKRPRARGPERAEVAPEDVPF